jgi:flavin reductase (DIM6/NTAB) family NADH-FMN oxidoreductase RutF
MNGATRPLQLASRKQEQRFIRLDTWSSESGALYVAPSPLWLECSVTSELPFGDHRVVVMEVQSLRDDPNVEPLIYHHLGFRQLAAAGSD